MAKAAVPGSVKTRLTRGPGSLHPRQAAAVHEAMLRTVITRLESLSQQYAEHEIKLVLAMDQPGLVPSVGDIWQVVEQGGGDLGERIGRVWSGVGGGPAAVFGVDCPDVPWQALSMIPPAVADGRNLVGPVEDGGYWTLAGPALPSMLLTGIDWGSARVYDQTVQAARTADLDLLDLEPWHDVDEPADLDRLLDRLQNADEPALKQLAESIHSILNRDDS